MFLKIESILTDNLVGWSLNDSIVLIEKQGENGIAADCVGTLIKDDVIITHVDCIWDKENKELYPFYFWS